ncbi:MAG: hypothetical protein QXU01_04055 [Candidatus Hadarchaeales archaeon]
MIEIDLNPSNFGEVLACLGLFELAELYCLSFGGFEEREGKIKFVLETEVKLKELIEKLKKAKISSLQIQNLSERKCPVEIELEDGKKLILDWWLDPLLRDKKTSFLKIWGGRMHLHLKGSEKRSYLARYQKEINVEKALENLFYRKPLVSLGFDTWGGWDRSTAGYSYDDVGEPPYVSPICELLSVIALRSFRPKEISLNSRKGLEYYLWKDRLPHSAARLAFVGIWIGKPLIGPWRLEIREKGQAYKHLTQSQRF